MFAEIKGIGDGNGTGGFSGQSGRAGTVRSSSPGSSGSGSEYASDVRTSDRKRRDVRR
jgi:hypothetical protein